MRMNRMTALAGAGVAVAFLAACSDSPSAPQSRSAFAPKSSFAVGDLDNSTPELGKVKVCKAGNAGGSFDVTRVAVNGGVGTVSGLNTLIATGTCRLVAEDQGGDQVGSTVTIVEDAAANTVSAVTGCVFIGSPGGIDPNPCDFAAADRFLNQFHGYVVTYTNTFTPPPPSGCTFTKGWYRNNGSGTLTGVDGLAINVELAIFAATPGKPGPVTWNAGNDALNLYQQLLAALENGGASGPAATQQAIADAQAGTSVSGFAITTTLTQAQISDLISKLTAFNEGSLPGFPHC
jgi:hypothetical protein